jgi:hypothetical protein
MKEGLSEISKLVGMDNAVFKDPQNIAALVGAQRFVMIWGEPSITDHVSRVFDSTKVLLTVLIEPGYFGNVTSGQIGPTSGGRQYPAGAKPPLSPGDHSSMPPWCHPPVSAIEARVWSVGGARRFTQPPGVAGVRKPWNCETFVPAIAEKASGLGGNSKEDFSKRDMVVFSSVSFFCVGPSD